MSGPRPSLGAPRPRSRVAQILSAYYDLDESEQAGGKDADPMNLDGPKFDSDAYLQALLRERSMKELVRNSNELGAEVKSLDGDLQTLVYENYSKFISATDTIRSMKANVERVEGELHKLSAYMQDINQSSEGINANLASSRAKIEQLNAVRGLVKKLQFIFELPSKLNRSVSCEAYAQAVHYYTTASAILNNHSDIPSFRQIKDEADDIMHRLRAQLREKTREEPSPLSSTPSGPPTQLCERMDLLLQLDEDDWTLRQLFVKRWTTYIQGEIERARKLQGETMMKVKALHDAAVKAAVRFASDFSSLFIGNERISDTNRGKARAQIEKCIAKITDLYLEALTDLLDNTEIAEPVLMEVLTQVDFNLRSLSSVVSHGEVVTDKCVAFVKAEIAKRVASITSAAKHKLQDCVAQTTGHGTQVHMKRQTPSRAYGKGESESLSLLVGRIAAEACAALEETCKGLRTLHEASANDKQLATLTTERTCSELSELHSSINLQLLEVGNLSSLHPHFGAMPSPPSMVEQRLLSVLLAAALSQSFGETKVWSSVTAFLANLAAESHKKIVSLFSEASLKDVWQRTSKALLGVYVTWAGHVCAQLATDGAAGWAGGGAPESATASIHKVINTLWMVQRDLFNAFRVPARQLDATPKLPNDDDRLCSARGRGAVLEKDIDRLFSQEAAAISRADLAPANGLTFVVQILGKVMTELARMQSHLDSHGLHQVQVDVRCLRWASHVLVANPAPLDVVWDEVLMSASDRCLEPSPLAPSAVAECVAALKPKLVFLA